MSARASRWLVIAALSVGMLGACLDVPEGPTPECTSSAECDTTNGEVCEEGLCWGNPPEGMFAAVVAPPADRKDLVPKEINQLGISEQGWISGLQLEKPVTLSGRIDAVCTGAPNCDRGVEASITITRDSHFPGGPGFKTVVTTQTSSTSGASYEVNLPPSRDGDPAYLVTVVPTGRGDTPSNTTTSAQLVPPLRMELAITGDMTKMITLGGQDLPVVDGTLLSSGGAGLAKHRVVALGHWEDGAPLTEVSTVDYTDVDGRFRLVLSRNLKGTVEIVAKPFDQVAPTLRLAGIPATSGSQPTLVQPPYLGTKVLVTFPVRGKDGGGEIAPVAGATVKVRATLDADLVTGTTSSFVVEGTTNDRGEVGLELLDGPAIRDRYSFHVVPPASAKLGVLFDQPLVFGAVQAALILPGRVPIRGVVLDAAGELLEGVAVTARPSLRFVWSLDADPQAFMSTIPASTTVTPKTGEFVLWVDPMVAGLSGHYDLVFEPPMAVKYPKRAPTWVDPEVAIVGTTTPPAREVRLPDAAFVHGQVTDAAGNVVEGAEVKVFRVTTSLSLCTMVEHAPMSCPIPATLQGRGDSDLGGVVRVTLPR